MNLAVAVRDLFAHMEWADSAVWRTVRASPGAAGASSVTDVLLHYSVTQRAFLGLWRGIPFDPSGQQVDALRDPAALLHAVRRYYQDLFAWLEGAGGELQQQPLLVPWADRIETRLGRPPSSITIGESMLQVAMHSAHHRGQLNARLREMGITPPLVDFIAWAWMGKPPAEWPEM